MRSVAAALPTEGATIRRPRVDIIVPAYNAEPTLGATLASLAQQSLGSWRATIVDDGSTDGTGRLAQQWARRDGRFRVIRQANRGLARARNAGVAEASGAFVFFLDADDVIEPTALEELAAAAESCGAAHCGYRFLDESLHPIGRETRATLEGVGLDELLGWCRFVVHAQLISRDVLGDARFDESLRTSEDYELWLRLACAGVRWAAVDRELAGYRIRAGSISKDFAAMASDAAAVIRRGFAGGRRSVEHESEIDLSQTRETRSVGLSYLSYATRLALRGSDGDADEAERLLRRGANGMGFETADVARAVLFGLQHGFAVTPDAATLGEAGWWTRAETWFERCTQAGWVSGEPDDFAHCFARLSVNPKEVARLVVARSANRGVLALLRGDDHRRDSLLRRVAAERAASTSAARCSEATHQSARAGGELWSKVEAMLARRTLRRIARSPSVPAACEH